MSLWEFAAQLKGFAKANGAEEKSGPPTAARFKEVLRQHGQAFH